MTNFHGLYYFSQTGRHVWHESLLEANTLRWLDMHADVTAIAAQPFELSFGDGTKHTPDYIALHADHQQVVYDTKPTKYIQSEKFQLQAAKTRAVCDLVGWRYEVYGSLDTQLEQNLAWVSAFKHPGYFPGNDAASSVVAALATPLPLIEAARASGLPTLAECRSALYNLIWVGLVSVDLTEPLSDSSIVERGRHAHA